MGSKRIEWIDLAKGFCIFLVVLNHVSQYAKVNYPLANQLQAFRMPLYFILSGLFFKQYEGFFGFLKRKTNKLLIPFLFFLVCTSLLPYWAQYHKFQWPLLCGKAPFYNGPIWFLLCLFEVNVLFFLIQWLAGIISQRYKAGIVLYLTLLFGVGGLLLSYFKLQIPFYVDTAFTCLPFFVFGWWMNRHTRFLAYRVNLWRDVPLLIAGAVILWLFAERVEYVRNFYVRDGIWYIHLTGIAGTVMVLTLARLIKRLPLVSYWGRYSIMILCTHLLVIRGIVYLAKGHISGWVLFTVLLATTLAVCHFLIPFMKRYMPHVTAQKDVIKIEK